MVAKTTFQTNTEDRVIEAVAWELNIPASMLNPYTDLTEDLYLDTIDKDLVIAQLEKNFNVVLSLEEVAQIETIRDMSHLIQTHAVS
ncbi:MAG: phosphopantetheine-binding protein [Bacteroidota bacterium]